jgi:hypothetical protein
MDIFSGNKLNINQPIYFDKIGNGPNLVSNNTMNDIGTLLKYKEDSNNSNDNISSAVPATNIITNINGCISNFYTNYIQPNIFFIILAVLFSLFLYWKYTIKNDPDIIDNYIEKYQNTDKQKSKKKKKIKKIEKKIKKIEDLIDTIESSSYDSIEKKDKGEFIANFNPSVPVSAQNSYSNYMENNIPIIVNNNIRNIDDNNANDIGSKNKITYNQYYNIQEPKYEYLPIIKNKINRNDTYTGLYNEYNNFADQGYNNPYEWEQNYNETTYNAIDYATTKNRESLQLLNQSVDNANNQIIKNIM